MTARIIPALVGCVAMILLAHCGESEAPPESAPPEQPEVVEEPAVPEPEPEVESKIEPEEMPIAEPQLPLRVRIETSKGAIVLELYPDKAPETVKNFLQYVDDKFYDQTIFHRVIPGFMIQGGGFEASMQEKSTRDPIQNESGAMANLRYTIAMARTPNPHSASAQFFINLTTNQFLDKDQAQDGWGYCVFGKVIEGTDAVKSIAEVATGMAGVHQDVPVTPVLINSARRVG